MKSTNVIVQAGGLGSRLETLTLNKPKCMVSIDNLPIIFKLFKKFPGANFKIIADYKSDVLEKYLKIFAQDVNFEIITTKEKGTCSGIAKAASLFEENEQVIICWCDLILSPDLQMPQKQGNFIGISYDFECRWSYKNNYFIKEPSKQDGVAGFFVFQDAKILRNAPISGEFVAWLANQDIKFERISLAGSKEIGTMLSS